MTCNVWDALGRNHREPPPWRPHKQKPIDMPRILAAAASFSGEIEDLKEASLDPVADGTPGLAKLSGVQVS
jgi:hypothetical protein